MTLTQELAVGTTIDQRFSKLGSRGVRFHPALTQCVSAWCGTSGEGKSSLLQSCPDAFILNTDLSSTSNPDPHAFIWPCINEAGQPTEADGSVIPDLTWGDCLERVEIVRDMNRNKVEGAPKLVVLDTIDTAVRLAMAHEVKSLGKTSWDELYGPAAWAAVHDQFVNLAHDNKRVGVGTAFILHLTTKTISEGEGHKAKKIILEDVPRLTDNFWGKLNDICEIVGIVEQGTTTRAVKKIRTNASTGEPILNPKTGQPLETTETIQIPRVIVSFEPRYKEVAKRRSGIATSIEIPPRDGWAVLEEAYRKGLEAEESTT